MSKRVVLSVEFSDEVPERIQEAIAYHLTWLLGCHCRVTELFPDCEDVGALLSVAANACEDSEECEALDYKDGSAKYQAAKWALRAAAAARAGTGGETDE
jgi:hypothetical protein